MLYCAYTEKELNYWPDIFTAFGMFSSVLYWRKLWSLQSGGLLRGPSAILRITVDPRKKKYYGDNFEKLYDDVLNYCPEAYENIKEFLNNIYDYLKEKNLTVTTYSHGDFHDFNFSLDGIFWDIDTFDFNPLLDDFATFYWHFYAREDYLVYKYCP